MGVPFSLNHLVTEVEQRYVLMCLVACHVRNEALHEHEECLAMLDYRRRLQEKKAFVTNSWHVHSKVEEGGEAVTTR